MRSATAPHRGHLYPAMQLSAAEQVLQAKAPPTTSPGGARAVPSADAAGILRGGSRMACAPSCWPRRGPPAHRRRIKSDDPSIVRFHMVTTAQPHFLRERQSSACMFAVNFQAGGGQPGKSTIRRASPDRPLVGRAFHKMRKAGGMATSGPKQLTHNRLGAVPVH
jgi:hypothetical protein